MSKIGVKVTGQGPRSGSNFGAQRSILGAQLCRVKQRAISRAPIANLGLWDYREKIWDYGITPCLKLGLQKSALKLGLCISNSTKFGFSIHSKLGLWDFTLFEIGITGLRLF